MAIEPGISFSSVADSIVALDPDLLEALDKDGNLIRAMRAEEDAEEEETEQGFAVPADPQSAQLIIFAKLIADAYKTSTVTAFDKLGELFAMVVGREQASARAAETWQRAFMKQVVEKAAASDDAGAGGFEQMMMQYFMNGVQRGQAEAAPKTVVDAHANGAAKKGEA